MEKGYFAAAWGDVTKSPGWASTLLRLGVLCLVPVFGVIVLYGYLFSWARDISWNVHRPLPKKLLANEDGALYRRGFFILVVTVAASLVLGIVSSLLSACAGAPFAFGTHGSYWLIAVGALLWLVGTSANIALAFLAALFVWVGSMRVSLYGTLSSGFQIRKIWSMMRYDFIGLLRILGMNILIGAAICFAAFVLAAFLVLFCGGLIWLASGDSSSTMFAAILLAVVGAAFVLAFLFATALQNALTIRALGYWTSQFEVRKWSGQEDPMPFERLSRSVPASADSQFRSSSSAEEKEGKTATSNDLTDTARYDSAKSPSVASPIPNANTCFVAKPAPFKAPGQGVASPAVLSGGKEVPCSSGPSTADGNEGNEDDAVSENRAHGASS